MANGGDYEDKIRSLRDAGYSALDSVRLLKIAHSLDLATAKRPIAEGATWKDQHDRFAGSDAFWRQALPDPPTD